MYIRINGKNDAIQKLERAHELIDELRRIIMSMPYEISLEIQEGAGSSEATLAPEDQ